MKTASVIIITKNRREDLLKAVESVMAQRGLLEVIVIDDGSTDGTAEELQKIFKHRGHGEHGGLVCSEAVPCLDKPSGAAFSNPSPSELTRDSENTSLIRSADGPASEPGASDSRLATAPEALSLDSGRSTLDQQTAAKPQLRLIRHEVSAGYIVRRNEGAREARGDVIFSLDDDALFSSPFVVEQTLLDFSHPRIGAVAIPYIEPHKANNEMQRAPTREDIWITASYIGTAHAVRRDVFLALGGYREHLVHQGEEGDFCLRMLAADAPHSGDSRWKIGDRVREAGLTTDYPDGHGWEKRRATPREPGLALSSQNSSTSEPARDFENTTLNHSALGPAEALRFREMESGGGDQLSDSGKFLEGQSQAGLQMDSQKHLTHRAAMGSTSSGDNSSSVSIREIRGKKKSEVQEALDASLPATSHSLPVTAPEVPGYFVRLGNSDPIIHNESPKRDYSRMDFYGRRNDVLFHWQNTPMPDLLWQLPMTIAGGLLCAYRVKRWREMLDGVGAGLVAIASGVKRQPVSKRVVSLHKVLKRSTQKFRIFIQ
jgi:glycosyltransferase involved in cell wall biosynthesis